MFTIDEIRIEGEEDGFVLNIFCEEDRELRRFKIGLPDQFDAEVRRTIGRWLAEGEIMRGYGFTDDDTDYARVHPGPKHPDYHDTMSDIHDNREGK